MFFMDSRRSNSVDEEAKIREKHQVLLQEFLVLQKDCVSKKRKLKEAKEKKEIVLDEIRFLKQRRSFLLKIQSQNLELQDVESQRPDVEHKAETSGRSFNATRTTFHNPRPEIGAMWNSGSVDENGGGFAPLRVGKKPKGLLTNGKRVEKRKISWQDPVALRV